MSAFDTDWPADSTEFCPHPTAQDIFVCGTYNLEQIPGETDTTIPQNEEEIEGESSGGPPTRTSQIRKGRCLLFRVHDDDQFTLLQQMELPAILDMKWCHRASTVPPLLGIADSKGHVTLHELRNEESRLHLHQLQSISCTSPDTLCLSLDWSNRRNPTDGLADLIVSLSNGSLSLLRPEGSGLTVTDSWYAHDYEPWIAAWDYWNPNVVYSGGDDLKMKGWDIRQGGSQPLFVNKRFDAGVTTIQSHPFIEHVLAVGSYDNSVRLFDTRKPLMPLNQVDVGGGAWRVKWHPSATHKNDLLVACMHDGFKVVRFDFGQYEDAGAAGPSCSKPGDIISRFDKHASLAYGVDWSFAGLGKRDDTLVASCSFYDHTLHTWRA